MRVDLLTIMLVFLGFLFESYCCAQSEKKMIWKTKEYSMFADRVIQQDKFVAKAISATELTSNYQSPANQYQSSAISFKFSINGKDNEMKQGVNHQFNCVTAINETPLLQFGEQLKDRPDKPGGFLKPGTRLTIRLDMRKVLADFKKNGYTVTYNGDKIFKEDFKGVWVAGGTAPMIWDFDNLVNHPDLQLKDPDGKGIYETTLVLNAQKDQPQTATSWKLAKDISAFPLYHSGFLLTDALYNLSLEEMINAVEPDSTFRTGKLWAGVWTRDISYSIILSMAYLQPRVAQYSLLKKVNKKGRIIQDTGTGGAYPASTDRMIWAVAAWEVYKATGDEDWLKQAYLIIKNSIEDDVQNAYDMTTGLVHGESSFLDWREQTYPKWMQPADIYESENLGTNAVHYQANVVLSEMAARLHHQEVSLKHKALAERIKKGINQYLWIKDKGYYAQYLYGRNFKIVSPRAEALGEALCVLFGIADAKQQLSIIAHTPVTPFGISCIYPQIPGIPPYHNNAVWPFVQSFWALASAKAGNEQSVIESIGAIERPAAMFLTNKENFVADNGDFAGTQINSGNMLWSLSGSLGVIHKVIFGIQFQADKLVFQPLVPEPLKGKRELTNFRYRNAVLDITMEGSGNKIQSFLLDGQPLMVAEIPASVSGKHFIQIVLANNGLPEVKINKVANYVSLVTPSVAYSSMYLNWVPVPGAVEYHILKNGQLFLKTTETKLTVPDSGYSEYQVIALDAKKVGSFASEPVVVAGPKHIRVYEVEDQNGKAEFGYKGFSGSGFTEISKTVNPGIAVVISVPQSGVYAVDFRYANGNGPTNTNNKCAIRTLKEGSTVLGTVVLPQRGSDEWSNWGYSNAIQVYLEKGKHTITLAFEPANENMNGDINQAMLDYMRVTKIK